MPGALHGGVLEDLRLGLQLVGLAGIVEYLHQGLQLVDAPVPLASAVLARTGTELQVRKLPDFWQGPNVLDDVRRIGLLFIPTNLGDDGPQTQQKTRLCSRGPRPAR